MTRIVGQPEDEPVSVDRSGLVAFEKALVLAVADRGRRSSADVLTKLAGGVPSFPPKSSYDSLAELTRQTCVPYPLVDGEGNFGTWIDDPADPEWTRCKPSAVGALAVSAVRKSGAPVPIDLFNGSLHRAGRRPGFRPAAIGRALTALVNEPGLAPGELLSVTGGPQFAGSLHASGNAEALLLGEPAEFLFTGRAEQHDGDIYVFGLPNGSATDKLRGEVEATLGRVTANQTYPSTPAVWIRKRRGEDLDALTELVSALPTMSAVVQFALPAPMEEILRSWVGEHGSRDTLAGARIAQAI